MRTTSLESYEDRRWLLDVHLKGARVKRIAKYLGQKAVRFWVPLEECTFFSAELEGNEDAPTKVSLYKQDHYRCIPWVFVADENGKLVYDEKASWNAGRLRPKTAREKEANCL